MRLNEHLCSSLTKEILQKLISVAHINTVNDLCILDESKIVYLSKMLQIDYQVRIIFNVIDLQFVNNQILTDFKANPPRII